MKLKFDYLAKCSLLLVMALGISSFAMAQRTITGTVTDGDTGDALIGANILVIGTSIGTVTDIDGTYSLQVPDDATELEFTYTGYAAERVTIGASNIVDVALGAGEVLSEIVVVGYGTVKKSDLTGSVTSVGEEDFNKGLITTPDQLLQGKAAGVQILNNSGQPGASTSVRIRGNSSIRAGNQPLFVVDGVQLTGASTRPGVSTDDVADIGNNAGSNPLNYLNPADIESIQVLKDASATAIYGSRGANGVVIITTKKGRAGAPTVNFSTSLGFSSILNEYDVLNANEYRAALNDYGLTSGDFDDDVDAMDEILQTGLTNNHNISISGGGDAGTYRLSLGYFDQEGIVKENYLQRLTANISGSYKFLESKRLGLDFNLITSRTKDNAPPISTSAGFQGSLIGAALQWNPTHPLYEENGDLIIRPGFGADRINPVALNEAYRDETNTTDIIFSVSPSYKITDNLTYKIDYALTEGAGTRNTSVASWLNQQAIADRGVANVGNSRLRNQILTHTLNFNQRLSSNVSLNAVVGYEYQKREESSTNIVARDFTVADFDFTNILQNSATAGGDARVVASTVPPDQELQSILGRANFNIMDKYLLTATFRADGSSKFGEDNRYGYFPAFAFAWNLHNEDFLADGPFDNLKLRLGWGQTGNSEFPAGAAQERWAFGPQTFFITNAANPELKWETTTNINAGIDFALFDYALTGTVEYFRRSSEDLLFNRAVAQPAPEANTWVNLEGMNINSGVELTLNTQILSNENLTWDLGVNATFLNNELKDYTGADILYGQLFGQGATDAFSMLLADGQPINSFYMQTFEGLNDQGLSEYGEAQFVGDANPDVILGLSTGLTYGNFNLVLNFNGALGQDIYNNTRMTVLPISNLGTRNIDASLVGNDILESTANPISVSDRFIEDGSYVKLQNATLGYNIGDLGNTVKNVRVFVSGTNLLVFTGYNGFDPEINTENVANGLPSFGIEYIPYPSARTVVLGANFSF